MYEVVTENDLVVHENSIESFAIREAMDSVGLFPDWNHGVDLYHALMEDGRVQVHNPETGEMVIIQKA